MKTCEACGYDNDEDAEFCARYGALTQLLKRFPRVRAFTFLRLSFVSELQQAL